MTPPPFAHQPFLKYYYYQQLRRGFKDGCVFRSSTSSDTREDRYRTMCLTYGDRPAIVGAAGRNADGSWGLNVVNLTSEPDRRPGVSRGSANYQPAATYNITYHVAELANAGTVSFRLYRSSSTVRDAYQGTVFNEARRRDVYHSALGTGNAGERPGHEYREGVVKGAGPTECHVSTGCGSPQRAR